jgi:RNA polymerase primary sigma factor
MSSEYFTDYLDEIGKVPLLTREREIELSQIIQRGLAPSASGAEMEASQEARMELSRHNLRLVVSIAHGFRDSSLTLEELTFTGNVGLMEAAKRFDGSEFQARFSTYAFYWIEMRIRDALWRARLIRTPKRHAQVYQRLRQAHSFREEQMVQDLYELHQETGISTKLIRRVLNEQCLIISLDNPAFDDHDDGIEATLPSDSKTPAVVVSSQEELLDLEEAVILLTPRERFVICHRFCLNGSAFKTLDQIAAHYRVSRERIRQIQNLALRKLRARLRMRGEP